jgi:hypothetical protein
MTMTIVGICYLEELKMLKITQGKYQQYRESAPFLFPLPRWLNKLLGWPGRLVTGGGYPARRRQVLWIVAIYTGLLMALSLIWMDLGRPGRVYGSEEAYQQELSEMLAKLEKAGDNRREIYALMEQIDQSGIAGEDTFLELASHPNNHIREFAIAELGSKKIMEAEDLLISSLHDSIRRVRSAAILSVGQIQSVRAVDSLISMLVNPKQNNNTFHIYGALGDIGDPKAIPILAKGLDGGERYNQTAALDAIMRIDPDEGLKHAYAELNDSHVEVRRHAVITCIKTGNPDVAEALKALLEDEDFEVRFYARQGIKRLKK